MSVPPAEERHQNYYPTDEPKQAEIADHQHHRVEMKLHISCLIRNVVRPQNE
jgi:hypothetical protein